MEYSMQKLDKSRMEIAVSFEKAEWDKHILEAYNKNRGRLGRQYRIEGFRPGKAPFGVFIRRYGKEVLFEDGVEIALNAAWKEILEHEEGFEPLGTPHVDIQECSEDGLKAVLAVDHYPEVKLGAYTGLTIEKVEVTVTDEEVDHQVEHEREHAARLIDLNEEPIEEGNLITLDYKGSIDGVEFKNGAAQNEELTIGSHKFIPGFEEQLIGLKAGEEKTITVKFPEDYPNKDLAGKDAQFKCKIHTVRRKEVPDADDEFAKDVSEFNTLAEYKADLKAKMIEEKSKQAEYEEENKLVEAITENAEIDLCDYLIEEEMDRMIDELRSRLAASRIRYEDFLTYIKKNSEEMRSERREDAIKAVKQRLCIEAIIKAEKLTVSDEEMDAELQKEAETKGKSLEAFKQGMHEYEMVNIINRLMSDKLFRFLRENNTIA